MRTYARHDEGQTLIVIALAAVVLVAAIALGIDWGYGLAQRRVMQDASDSAAMAGARLLAGSVVKTPAGLQFRIFREEVWCTANQYANANRFFRPSGATEGIIVEGSTDKVTFTPFNAPAGGCPPTGQHLASGTEVPTGTRFVRVRSTVDYRSLFASAAGKPAISAAATALAQIVGIPVGSGGPVWPMVRHYNQPDFTSPCGTPCAGSGVGPITFWSSSSGRWDKDMVFGSFKGLADFSRYSPNINQNAPPALQNCYASPADPTACVPQLIDHWDATGEPPTGKANLAGGSACNPPAPAGRWFAGGNEKSQQYDKDCSVPNWTAHAFNGSLSLENDWTKNSPAGKLQPGQEKPSPLSNTREVCGSVPQGLKTPSCAPGGRDVGDWVEVSQKGDLGKNMAGPMRAYILAHPSYDLFQHVKTGPGIGSPEYGPYAVINVYLWDCAESFTPSALPGSQFALAMPKNKTKNDCSDIHDGNDTDGTIDRVHLFTVAPFTFYLGLVDSNNIQGFWGGSVSSAPGQCADDPGAPGCEINLFSNAVFLVAED